MEKYLSIITNFGCHYSCPYCIVKNNNIKVPKTTLKGLDNLKQVLIRYGCNIVSVSGGGDPLHEYEKHTDWYEKLFDILEGMGIPLEVHTSYIHNNFPIKMCKRVVYHLNNKSQLSEVVRKNNEIVRVVYVVTKDMTMQDILDITDFVKGSTQIDELSFRQMVGSDYNSLYHLHDELKAGHKRDWWYIEQYDYNLYYAENKLFKRYEDLKSE